MRKKRILFSCMGLGILLLIVPTLSYLLRELLNKQFDALSGSHMLDVFLSFQTYVSFVSQIDPENILGWVGIGFYVCWSVIEYVFSGIREKGKFDQKEEYASHGTSRWQTPEEITKHYYGNDHAGWFLGHTKMDVYRLGGKFAYHATKNVLNSQMIVIGPPGTKKTTGFMYGNIFHIPYSTKADMIITDPKSELFMYTASYLEEQGYDVQVLDFIHLKYGNAINPLEFINEEKELMEVATGFISAATGAHTGGKSGSGDPIWENGEALLLASLIGFVLQKYPPHKRTFEEVAKLLTSEEIRDAYKAESFFAEHNIVGAAKDLYDKFLMLEDRVRTGVLAGLAIKLTLFSISGIKQITGRTTLDIRKLGAKKERPMAVFICMPDGDKTYAPIINVIVTMMMNQMYKTAYDYGNKLHTPVYMALDELANIGRLPGLIEKLPTMRGRGIIPMMIFQSLVQMKERYKDQWEEILGMCDTQVYLGVNEQTTAKYLSDLLGVTTIKIQNASRNTKEGKITGDGLTESYSYQQRPLLFPDECRSLDRDNLIIVQGGRHPVMLKKVQYEYWEKKHRICEPREMSQLPLLSPDGPINTIFGLSSGLEVQSPVESDHPSQSDDVNEDMMDWQEEVAVTTEVDEYVDDTKQVEVEQEDIVVIHDDHLENSLQVEVDLSVFGLDQTEQNR